ncbi:MAG TPA: hypothetical protein VFK25_12675 [Candidatus Binatia bacterium]|nr:hypothetical protein [Candidatus Binatia bacterium]
MNCVEARKYFADLLDHSRDERLRKVNDHVTACARCTEELADLAACHRLVAALPPVEAPLGFTARVMAEAHKTAHRPSLWERLFSTITKLPLQATAVVVIGILAVFVYQKESRQPEWTTRIPPASPLQKQDEADKSPPAGGGVPAAESKVQESDESGAQERGVKRSPQTEQSRSRSRAEPEEQSNIIGGVQPGARKAAPPPASVNPAKVAPSKPKEESSPAGETSSVRQEQSLRLGGAQAKGAPPSAPLRDLPSSAGLEEKRAASSLDALSSGTAGFVDRELILRLKHPARNDRSTGTPSELERPHAEASPSQRFEDLERGREGAIRTGQPQTVSAIIDAGQYDGLKKDLASLGNIESERPEPAYRNDAVSKSSNQLRIKVTILPPLPSAELPSSR